MFYAGIGSRETPVSIQRDMTQIAAVLAEKGYILRSGHADGADWAFEQGAADDCEIFLPWPGFNAKLISSPWATFHGQPSAKAFEMAAKFHPAWNRLKDKAGARALHARNCHQIMGESLDDPVKFVICWTKDGGPSGGTGQAIRIAEAHSIPVFNLQREADYARVTKLLTPCANCGTAPCCFQCYNSPNYLDPRREKEDALAHDAMSHSEWLSEAHKQYERVHGEPYVS